MTWIVMIHLGCLACFLDAAARAPQMVETKRGMFLQSDRT